MLDSGRIGRTLPINWAVAGRGFVRGAAAGAILAGGLSGLDYYLGWPQAINVAILGALTALFLAGVGGVMWLLQRALASGVQRLDATRLSTAITAVSPQSIGHLLGVAALMAGHRLFPDSPWPELALPAALQPLVLTLAGGGALVALARRQRRPIPRTILVSGALLLNGLLLGWLLHPGTAAYLPSIPPPPATAVPTSLPHPGQPGPYPVRTLTYGSGSDRRRPEYGAGADLLTPTVDGAPLFAGYGGLADQVHRWFWGFDWRHLPLNGRVWYPIGPGPFPLALIVHGNHDMGEFSDPGYAYLGRHLAGRGIITVSVDENFLNGFFLADGKGDEMALRAWLLRRHLFQWQQWQETPGNPFSGGVDLSRVALIGHSRGGEAAVHAAALDRGRYAPFTAMTPPESPRFDVRAVVGLAPTANLLRPEGEAVTLEQASYLALLAGHDGDLSSARGLAAYNRVGFRQNPDGFAAVAYLYRANHGQFNTVWGKQDQGHINSLLLRRRPYLSGEAQRAAATVLITAFLEATLNGQDAYRAVWRTPAALRAWLPADIVTTAYKDGSLLPVSGFEQEDGTQIDVAGGTAVSAGFRTVTREALMLRDGKRAQENGALRLAWDPGQTPTYTLALPEAAVAGWGLTAADELTFALAWAGEEARPLTVTVALETAVGPGNRAPNSVDRFPFASAAISNLRITDNGLPNTVTGATLSLNQFGALPPPLPAYLFKSEPVARLFGMDRLRTVTPYERVLQKFHLPLATFQEVNPRFQPGQIRRIRFHFHGPDGGALYLDDVGFLRGSKQD